MPGKESPLMDPEFYRELVNYIEVGNYVQTACAAMGIREQTYYRWLQEGRSLEAVVDGAENEQELREALRDGKVIEGFSEFQCQCWRFMTDITVASARAEAFAVAMVRKHMPDQWTAAMTFLERRHPRRWKRKEQIDIGEAGADAGGIDETLLLEDPHAVKLVHDALERVSKPAQIEPAKVEETIIDATVVEETTLPVHRDDKSPPPTDGR